MLGVGDREDSKSVCREDIERFSETNGIEAKEGFNSKWDKLFQNRYTRNKGKVRGTEGNMSYI